MEKYVYLCWEPGEDQPLRTGTLKSQPYFKFYCKLNYINYHLDPYKLLLCQLRCTLMNLAMNMNKVRLLERRKMKAIQILSVIAISSLQ